MYEKKGHQMAYLKGMVQIPLVLALFFIFVPWTITKANDLSQPVKITWQHYLYEEQDHYYPATLNFDLQPGWKLYAPYGDFAGSAPKLDWQSGNIASIDLLWPEPEQISSKNPQALGYTKKLELPLKVVTKDPSQPTPIEMKLSYVVCSAAQCIPQETIIKADIDPHTTARAEKQLLASYRQTVQNQPPVTNKPVSDFNTFTILIWAFVGGLILNVMPCVLPVLSLKLMSVLRFQGQARQHVRRGFFLSALGIMAAFLGLSVIFAGLKTVGATIGWGVHFQNPYFLIGLILIISFFFFNVLGLWHFKQPQLSMDYQGTGKMSWLRDFGEGVLVMILATPCTAPFVGAALGVALGQSWPFMMMILMTLSLGLAMPYLLVAMFPKVVALLPHPGKWMNKVRWVMALALGLTVAWLLYVLHTHIGNEGILIMLALLIAIGGLLWQGKRISSKIIRAGSVSLLSVVLFSTPLWNKTSSSFVTVPLDKNKNQLSSSSPYVPRKKGEWLPFDPDMIEKLVAENKIVLVDVTADWCLLCQVNKQTVLNDSSLQRYFNEGKITPMRADWTNRDDPRIIEYIQSFQRYGIPMNVLYGPNAKEGILLSEWLTVEEIEAAYEEALPSQSGEALRN